MPIFRFFDGEEWVFVDANNARFLNGKTEEDFASATHVGSAYADDGGGAHPIATDVAPGFMSPEDREKLDLLRVEHLVVSEDRPDEPYEGLFWYHPKTEDTRVFADGKFRYLSGKSLEDRLGRMNANMIDLGVELEILKTAELRGVDANIYLETFQTIEDVTIKAGTFDEANRRITF